MTWPLNTLRSLWYWVTKKDFFIELLDTRKDVNLIGDAILKKLNEWYDPLCRVVDFSERLATMHEKLLQEVKEGLQYRDICRRIYEGNDNDEWNQGDSHGRYCPFCGNYEREDHTDDCIWCQVQKLFDESDGDDSKSQSSGSSNTNSQSKQQKGPRLW